MATILKVRADDQGTVERILPLPDEHPRHLAPTIALRELVDLVKEYQSRFGSKKELNYMEISNSPKKKVLLSGLKNNLDVCIGSSKTYSDFWF